MVPVETYTATACGDDDMTFEVIRWIVDEIPPSHVVAVRLGGSANRGAPAPQYVCAIVDRTVINLTDSSKALMCVDSGFTVDHVEQCRRQWETCIPLAEEPLSTASLRPGRHARSACSSNRNRPGPRDCAAPVG